MRKIMLPQVKNFLLTILSSMKYLWCIMILVSILLMAWCSPKPISTDTVYAPDEEMLVLIGTWVWSELIEITSPEVWATLTSPAMLAWSLPGYRYFEATAPAQVIDSNDLMLWEWYVSAIGERMTESLVPFSWSVVFSMSGSTATTWEVIIRRNNASGMSENDASIRIPVVF